MQPTLAPAPDPRAAPIEQRPVNTGSEQANHAQQPQADTSEQMLRERLLASVQSNNLPKYQPHRPEHLKQHSHNQNIDPAIAGSGIMNHYPGGSEGSGEGEGRQPRGNLGKRELSTTKRAAQNRQAQRAFRQRKEGHIKELETKVEHLNELSERFQAVQSENFHLRGYIMALQGTLLKEQGRYPPPPPHINIQPHRTDDSGENNAAPTRDEADEQDQINGHAPTASMTSFGNDLQSSAAEAVAQHQQRNQDSDKANAGRSKRPRTAEASPPNGQRKTSSS